MSSYTLLLPCSLCSFPLFHFFSVSIASFSPSLPLFSNHSLVSFVLSPSFWSPCVFSGLLLSYIYPNSAPFLSLLFVFFPNSHSLFPLPLFIRPTLFPSYFPPSFFLLSNTLLSPLPPCLLPCLLPFAFSVSFLAFILYTVLHTFYFPTSSTVSSLFPSFCTHFLPPCIVPFLNSFPLFICPTTYLSYPPFSLLYPSLTPLLSLLCPVFFLLIPSVLFSFPPSSCHISPCCLCLVSFFFSWPFLHPCLLPFSLLAVSISLLSSSFTSSVLLSLPHLLISFPQLPSSVLS